MEEIILKNKKHGMSVLLITIAVYILAIAGVIAGAASGYAAVTIVSVAALVIFMWVPMGLKVLKPQEALVLTLFGKYVGTLKGEGFYFVNPFCTAVNPAAKTKLNQSGDVDSHSGPLTLKSATGSFFAVPSVTFSIVVLPPGVSSCQSKKPSLFSTAKSPLETLCCFSTVTSRLSNSFSPVFLQRASKGRSFSLVQLLVI